MEPLPEQIAAAEESQDRLKMVAVMLSEGEIARIDAIAQRIAKALRLKRSNRSDALRRAIEAFDVEAWLQERGIREAA